MKRAKDIAGISILLGFIISAIGFTSPSKASETRKLHAIADTFVDSRMQITFISNKSRKGEESMCQVRI